MRRIFKIYIYPLLILVISLIPWYLFARFVLKLDLDQYVLQISDGSESSARGFKLFFLVSYIISYILFVFTLKYIEKAPEQRLVNFFLSYGKSFAIFVSISFVVFIVLISLAIFFS